MVIQLILWRSRRMSSMVWMALLFHFLPPFRFPVPGCSGVNLFVQDFSQYRDGPFSNPYVFPLLLSSLPSFAFFRALACHLLLLFRTFPQGNTGGLFCVLQLVILFFLLQKELWALSLFHLKGVFPPIGPFPGIFGFLGYVPPSLFNFVL